VEGFSIAATDIFWPETRFPTNLVVMKKLTFTAIFGVLTACTSISTAQTRPAEEALYHQLTNENSKVSGPALELVVKRSQECSADILYIACNVALRQKRLEDAGFLFYIAPFRAKFDSVLFPPKQNGADDPMLAYAETRATLGPVLNPEIIRQPKVYTGALARVKSWQPKVAESYTPWWEYSQKTTPKQAEEAIAKDRAEFMQHMSGLGKLLQDQSYFAALKTAQDYNLKLSNDKTRPSEESYQAALRTMERIEKEKGIEGLAAITKGTK
jgi:hypothetical protein